MTENENYLICRAGSRLCALSLASVRETMRQQPVSPLRGMPPFVLGLSVIRGAPTPVIDAARLLGESGESDGALARFIALRVGDRTAALATGPVLGIRALDGELVKAPSLLGSLAGDAVKTLGTVDRELLLVLESSLLVPHQVWSRVESQAAE